MFSYFSQLLEEFHLDEIRVNFLIVGHTHSSIDQYFSVLSKAIKSAAFIASPLALSELLRNAHSLSGQTSKRPYLVRPLVVYYDMKQFYAPYQNKKLSVSSIVLLCMFYYFII
jgi:hypothetical protein